MKVGDLVRMKRSHFSIGIVIGWSSPNRAGVWVMWPDGLASEWYRDLGAISEGR